jgi:hypothetical protein
MLAVSIPDLKPTSQDTSTFYLANIYQLLAHQNTPGLIPPTLKKPPAFSPPGYVVWANTLWLLSLLLSLFGAMIATLEQRFIHRYITITQSKEFPPETRARMHAMFVKTKSYGLSSTKTSLVYLHYSFLLFILGFLVYFANVNRQGCWILAYLILMFVLIYTLFTVSPIFSPGQLFYTPLSPLVLCVYLSFTSVVSRVFSWIKPLRGLAGDIRRQRHDLHDRYRAGFNEGKTKFAEEAALKPSSRIDAEVLERILFVLNEDHALEEFLDAIPGFCDSNLVQKPLDSEVRTKLRQSLDGFLDRTFSSHLVTESVRSDRLVTCLNAAHSALGSGAVSEILGDFFKGQRDEALKSVKLGHSLRRWARSSDDLIEPNVRRIIACIIARAKDRDEQWTMLVKEVFGVQDWVIRNYLPHGDSLLLATLIHVTREGLQTGCASSERSVLEALSQFDVHDTLPELQHDFCSLWNEIVQEARNEEAAVGDTTATSSTQTLAGIRPLFDALHQSTSTDAAPNQFSASFGPIDYIQVDATLIQPSSSYSSCDVPSHRSYAAAFAGSVITPPITGITTPTPPALPSDSIQASPRPILANNPPSAASLPDVATEDAVQGGPDAFVISNTTGLTRGSTSGGGPAPALQQAEDTKTISPTDVFASLQTPISSPAFCNQFPAGLPTSTAIDSAVTHTDHVPHVPAASSSTLTTVPLSYSPRVTTVSGRYPVANEGTAGAQDDTTSTYPPISREAHPKSPPGGDTGH